MGLNIVRQLFKYKGTQWRLQEDREEAVIGLQLPLQREDLQSSRGQLVKVLP